MELYRVIRRLEPLVEYMIDKTPISSQIIGSGIAINGGVLVGYGVSVGDFSWVLAGLVTIPMGLAVNSLGRKVSRDIARINKTSQNPLENIVENPGIE